MKLFCRIVGHKFAVVEEYGNIIRLQCCRCGKRDARLTDGKHKKSAEADAGQDGCSRSKEGFNGSQS